MHRIELRNVTKRFGSVTAVDHVDLVIEKGDFLFMRERIILPSPIRWAWPTNSSIVFGRHRSASGLMSPSRVIILSRK